jgi:hypothetical protein
MQGENMLLICKPFRDLLPLRSLAEQRLSFLAAFTIEHPATHRRFQAATPIRLAETNPPFLEDLVIQQAVQILWLLDQGQQQAEINQ